MPTPNIHRQALRTLGPISRIARRSGDRSDGGPGVLRGRPSGLRFTIANASTRSAPGPRSGTVADSYDNALAETTNGLYKSECVRGPDAPAVWDDVDQLELETLSWVHWFNEHRPHGHCGDLAPAEFEATFYAAQQTDLAEVGNQ